MEWERGRRAIGWILRYAGREKGNWWGGRCNGRGSKRVNFEGLGVEGGD